MTGKILGKISRAEYGLMDDGYSFGLYLEFTSNALGISTGTKYMFNISPRCEWTTQERAKYIEKTIDRLKEVLDSAHVDFVSQLKDKPVEIEIEGNIFKNFRILTEVL